LSGKPLSEVHRSGRTPLTGWRVLKIGLEPPRQALYERIERRTEAMLTAGWLDEGRRLVAAGLSESAQPLDLIGYRELGASLRGESTLEAAKAAIAQSTRQYAKRQLTWFRREADVRWLAGSGDDPQIRSAARSLVAGQVPKT